MTVNKAGQRHLQRRRRELPAQLIQTREAGGRNARCFRRGWNHGRALANPDSERVNGPAAPLQVLRQMRLKMAQPRGKRAMRCKQS